MMVLVIIPYANVAIMIIDFKGDCYKDGGGHSHKKDCCMDEVIKCGVVLI